MAEITVTLASQMITDDVLEINTIARSTDYPFATETQPSTTHLMLSDPDGNYSPENANNFFTDNSQNQNGVRCPVEVLDGSKVLFDGEILEVSQVPNSARVTVRCIDKTRPIRVEELADFGLQKAWKLIQDVDLSAVSGVYPLGLGTTPISDDSATISKALNEELNIVSEVKDSGVLDSDNVEITDVAVFSEGGAIDAVAGGAYPQMTAKTPYRYKSVRTLLNAVLAHYSISGAAIDISTKTIDLHAESLGRAGYESLVGELGSATHLNWNGYVTDILEDSGTLYFAYTVNRGQAAFSRILTLDTATDTWETLYTFADSGREVWGLAKIGDNLVMLITDDGSYDASESSNTTQILYFDVTVDPPSVGVLVGSSEMLKPQLATFFQNRMLPDTRRRLVVDGSNLYYGYAKSDKDFGVAQVSIGGSPSVVLEANYDNNYNHAAFAYARDSGVLYFGVIFLSQVGSTLKIVKST